MSPRDRETSSAVAAAVTAAGLMIAFQMAGKATRDALFLSSYDVALLPRMIVGTALASLAFAFVASRWMTRVGPSRLVPMALVLSAGMLLAEWALVSRFRGPISVVLYLHYGALGAVLISSFWSVVNERFDPRTAKKVFGRITAGGTVGGLAGGVMAERVAAMVSDTAMLPLLATLQLAAAAVVLWIRPSKKPASSAERERGEGKDRPSGLIQLGTTPYLRGLMALVLLLTVGEVVVDYVFKAGAAGQFGNGVELLRFFAVFYTGASLLTVVVQATASRRALQRLGLTRTVALLPAGLAAGSAGAIFVPGLVGVSIARGLESVLRNGLYRAGYELLYTPVPKAQKRATKTLVDVGVVRLGDVVGGAVVQLLLLSAAGVVVAALLGLAVAVGLVAVVVALRLHAGYVRTLERSLLSRAVRLDLEDIHDSATRTAVLKSIGTLGLTAATPAPGAPIPGPVEPTAPQPHPDPEVQQVIELRSRIPSRVRAVLTGTPLSPTVAAHAIPLLAWDDVVRDVIRALRSVAGQITGQLVDRLVDRDEEFSVRRRVPLVLASCASERAVDGLFWGLEDTRFEVRYRCGRALSRILQQHPELQVDRERTFAAALREVAVDRGVWESHRLLDRMDDDDWSPVMDEVLRDRADRSLEHVFTVLSLVLPRQPLRVAFRGLHTDDRMLRGTALEYLETALPENIRRALWPFLVGRRATTGQRRSADQVLKDLLASNESIVMNLENLRRKKE